MMYREITIGEAKALGLHEQIIGMEGWPDDATVVMFMREPVKPAEPVHVEPEQTAQVNAEPVVDLANVQVETYSAPVVVVTDSELVAETVTEPASEPVAAEPAVESQAVEQPGVQ